MFTNANNSLDIGIFREKRRHARAPWMKLTSVGLVSAAMVLSFTADGFAAAAATKPKANVAAAKAAIAPYLVAPKTFPVTTPLPTKLPAGTSFVYLQCGTPICAEVGGLIQLGVETIGGTYTAVNVGETAQTAQAGAASALALKPNIVILGAIDPSLFGDSLKTLASSGATLLSLQVTQPVQQYGITFNYLGKNLSERNGRLMADWVIAHKGSKANVVLYSLPTLDISAPTQAAFQSRMKYLCKTCKVRVVPIDASTIGTTAPNTVVTDLQAHPKTNTAVFVSLSAAEGLPAALKAAGLKITTLGFGPTAGNLQDIKDGAITAALDIDFPVSTFTGIDAAARLFEGSKPTANEDAGVAPEQFLGKQNITFNPNNGWTAFPNFVTLFGQLWAS
jgi:ribose transport system substrate-binding protein